MQSVDCIVAGAGVIGLAIARALAQSGREVVLLERNGAVGSETSSRNNEVLHAGFLYPEKSLKARLCRPGQQLAYAYCEQRGIPHRQIGKLMIATREDEISLLADMMEQAPRHGVTDLQPLDALAVAGIEPQVQCQFALYSPTTGIVDSSALMFSILADVESAGATVAFETSVTGGESKGGSIVVHTIDAAGRAYSLGCRAFVNAAGLGARDIACAFHTEEAIPIVNYAKGNFFTISGSLPFTHLVVPVGQTLSDGGALTIDVNGAMKFGPDLEWVTNVDYTVDCDRATTVANAIRRYCPDFDAARLQPGFAGIRPRLATPAGAASDWLIHGPQQHGIDGLYHLLGFDTPGLTACFAIANHIETQLRGT